ncbi:MAG: GAF domain-containing protein, partial [Candidatus Methylomirabilales bacterium]
MVESQRPDPSIEGVLSQLGHAANLGISPEEFLTRAIDGLLQVAQAPAGVACLVNPEGNKLEVVSIRRIGAAVARTLPHAFHLDVERGSGQFARPIPHRPRGVPGTGGAPREAQSRGDDRGDPAPSLERRTAPRAPHRDVPRRGRTGSDACRRTVGARSFSIWRADNRTRDLSLLYADPADGGLPRKGKRVGFGSGLLGWTAFRQKPRITADVSAELPAAAAERYRKSGSQASVTLPLLLDKELLGVLYLGAAAPLSAEDL